MMMPSYGGHPPPPNEMHPPYHYPGYEHPQIYRGQPPNGGEYHPAAHLTHPAHPAHPSHSAHPGHPSQISHPQHSHSGHLVQPSHPPNPTSRSPPAFQHPPSADSAQGNEDAPPSSAVKVEQNGNSKYPTPFDGQPPPQGQPWYPHRDYQPSPYFIYPHYRGTNSPAVADESKEEKKQHTFPDPTVRSFSPVASRQIHHSVASASPTTITSKLDSSPATMNDEVSPVTKREERTPVPPPPHLRRPNVPDPSMYYYPPQLHHYPRYPHAPYAPYPPPHGHNIHPGRYPHPHAGPPGPPPQHYGHPQHPGPHGAPHYPPPGQHHPYPPPQHAHHYPGHYPPSGPPGYPPYNARPPPGYYPNGAPSPYYQEAHYKGLPPRVHNKSPDIVASEFSSTPPQDSGSVGYPVEETEPNLKDELDSETEERNEYESIPKDSHGSE
jgi:hypothetical protein